MAGVRVLVLGDAHVGQDLALDDDLGVGDRVLIDRDAARQHDRASAHPPGDRQLIGAQRGSRRLQAGREVNRRVQTNADRYWQRPAPGLGPGTQHVDVPAGGENDADHVRPLHAQHNIGARHHIGGGANLGPGRHIVGIGNGGGQPGARFHRHRRAQRDEFLHRFRRCGHARF